MSWNRLSVIVKYTQICLFLFLCLLRHRQNLHPASGRTSRMSVMNKRCLLWYIVRHWYEHRALRVGWQERAWVGRKTGNISNPSNMTVYSVYWSWTAVKSNSNKTQCIFSQPWMMQCFLKCKPEFFRVDFLYFFLDIQKENGFKRTTWMWCSVWFYY